MNMMDALLTEPLFQALGWSLLHFIWQGALVALLLAGANLVLRRSTANKRYVASCLALLLMTALPIATFILLASEPQQTKITVTNSPQVESVNENQNGETVVPASIEPTNSSQNESSIVSSFSQENLKKYLAAWMPYLVSVWLFGVFLLSVRAIGGWLVVQRLKRKFNKEACQEWQKNLSRLAKQLRVSRPVRLCESALAEVPTVIGWLRPVILVPVGTLTGLSPQQVEALLAHELAHIRRYDYLVNLLQTAVETLLFYHPAVWYVSHQIRNEREHCCDDLAVAACGNVLVYARALTELEGLRHSENQLAMAADGGSLSHRVRRLLGLPIQPQRSTAWLASLFIITTVTFVTLGASHVVQPVVNAGTEAKNFVVKKVFGEEKSANDTARSQANTPSTSNQSKEEDSSLLSKLRKILAPPQQPAPVSPTSSESSPTEPSGKTIAIAPDPETYPTPPTQSSSDKNNDKDDEESGDLIDELKAAGYTNIKVDDLIAMKVHGVTGKFIRDLRDVGFNNLPANKLVAFRVHGVTPVFISEMKKIFGTLDANDLIAMRVHGLTPQYAGEMNSLLGSKLDVDELVAFRVHGVTAQLVKEFSSIGFTNLDADDLVAIRVHGLTTGFVQEIQSMGFGKLSLSKLLALKVHGVTPAFIKKVRDKGFTDLTLDQIIQMKNLGIIRDK